ncbi:hypothetical protein Pfo_024664, partial [Paulownia fortunei]
MNTCMCTQILQNHGKIKSRIDLKEENRCYIWGKTIEKGSIGKCSQIHFAQLVTPNILQCSVCSLVLLCQQPTETEPDIDLQPPAVYIKLENSAQCYKPKVFENQSERLAITNPANT